MPVGPPSGGSSPALALRAAAEAATSVRDLPCLLEQAVGHMAQLLQEHRCSILLVEHGRLRTGASLGLSQHFVDAVDGLRIGPEVGTCGTAAANAETTITTDVLEDPRWADFRELAAQEGVRSCWSVPLIDREGTVLATFATYGDEPREPSADQLVHAETLAAIVVLGIESHRHVERSTTSQAAIIRALTSALDARDAYTKDHSAVTAELAIAVGRRLALDDAALSRLEQTAVLHDVGKLGIPNEILHSPDPLTPEQWALMRTHPEIGERILSHVPGMEELAKAVRHEHERWDGRGYPDGVAGDRIPLASRVVFACDAYHAMTSDRPYRAAMTREAAVKELRANAGVQFDPRVAAALLAVIGEQPDIAGSAHDAEERARATTLDAMARAVGAEDLFVFRRIHLDAYSHVGGVGRGAGWAGNIEVDAEDEQHVLAALAAGTPSSVELPATGRIVGPYYGRSAVIVPAGDAVVVFGSSTDSLVGADPAEASAVAARAAEILAEVSPAKRLADELEVLDAVRSVMTLPPDSVDETLRGIADRIAAALSCEFGALVLFDPDGPRVGWADRGWRPDGDRLDDRLVGFARDHLGRRVLEQDADATRSVVASLGECEGAAAVHVLPVGHADDAILLVIHAEPVMRGFTNLCQRLAASVVDASDIVIRRAAAQERLRREKAELEERVRTDALTGALNRGAWQEIVMAEELHRSRHGGHVSVAICDVDGLKGRNDRDGHAAGDRLLLAGAEVLAACARGTDVVARVGGDEFAVLLRYCDEESAAEWHARVTDAIAARNAVDPGLALEMSCGWAQAADGQTLHEAVAVADRRMYAAKAARRVGS